MSSCERLLLAGMTGTLGITARSEDGIRAAAPPRPRHGSRRRGSRDTHRTVLPFAGARFAPSGGRLATGGARPANSLFMLLAMLTLTVNGVKHEVSAAAETPLLYVLRNDLKLTGPRLGCGLAQCGACAVLVDGTEVRSCITPVSAVVGKPVTTIEGLPAVWAAAKGLS